MDVLVVFTLAFYDVLVAEENFLSGFVFEVSSSRHLLPPGHRRSVDRDQSAMCG